MISNIGSELEELFASISSPQSHKAALSLFTATSQELANSYRAEDNSTPAQQALYKQLALSPHTEKNL